MLGPDGRIYCIPSDADRVLRIDPATHECVEIGETLDPNPHPINEIPLMRPDAFMESAGEGQG